VFKISTKKKGMSSLELSEEFEIRQKTVWQFKLKIQQAMASSKQIPLKGVVHVDEFLIGEYEEGKPGRSSDSKKKLVVVALEILVEKGVGRAYSQVINSASAKEFRPFFKAYISPDAHVITDVWKGYLPLKKEYPFLEQIPSKRGANFNQMHIHIMNIQGWLRGIHHHCTKQRLQGYLDEYHYRYNRRAYMGSIFDLTIKRMVLSKPMRLNDNKLITAV
jgi:transposase-like protein